MGNSNTTTASLPARPQARSFAGAAGAQARTTRDSNRPDADATQTCPTTALLSFVFSSAPAMFKRGIRTSTFAKNHTVRIYAVAIGPFLNSASKGEVDFRRLSAQRRFPQLRHAPLVNHFHQPAFSVIAQQNFVAWLDFCPGVDQRIRVFDPLPTHQIVPFPAAQCKMPVVLQDERRGVAGNYFALHLGLRALVAARDVGGFSGTCGRQGEENDDQRPNSPYASSDPNASHGSLHVQVAWLRTADPGRKDSCNSFAKWLEAKYFIYNDFQKRCGSERALVGSRFPAKSRPRELFCSSLGC